MNTQEMHIIAKTVELFTSYNLAARDIEKKLTTFSGAACLDLSDEEIDTLSKASDLMRKIISKTYTHAALEYAQKKISLLVK